MAYCTECKRYTRHATRLCRAHRPRKPVGCPRRLTDRQRAESRLCAQARRRANRAGLPFSLTRKDVRIPDVCPVLGSVLKWGRGPVCDSSATLDRRIPTLGYVPSNVRVISMRANRLKGFGTLKDFRALVRYLGQKEE